MDTGKGEGGGSWRRELMREHLQPEGCWAEAGDVLEEQLTHVHRDTVNIHLWFAIMKIFPYSFFSILGNSGDYEHIEWLWDVARLGGEGKWWLWRHSCLQGRRNSSWTWLWCMEQRGGRDRGPFTVRRVDWSPEKMASTCNLTSDCSSDKVVSLVYWIPELCRRDF